jgi:TetR/AcrR family transcriptional regulator, regulator of autoinduction and epiphytic fitness
MATVNHQKKLTYRQKQAQGTRNMIVTAAQALFLEQGYICTTIDTIAERAGVATSTVYAIFGSKRGILRAIRDSWHERSHIREVLTNADQSADPKVRLEKLAQATRKQWEIGAEVNAIYTGAAAADPRAAAELTQGMVGRREGLRDFAHSLEAYLRPGLDVSHAATILQVLCMPEVFDELVRRSGWSTDEYEAWLFQTLENAILKA